MDEDWTRSRRSRFLPHTFGETSRRVRRATLFFFSFSGGTTEAHFDTCGCDLERVRFHDLYLESRSELFVTSLVVRPNQSLSEEKVGICLRRQRGWT